MANELDPIVVKMLADADQYLRSIKEAEKSTGDFESSISSLAGTAASTFAALGAGQWVREALHNWSEQESANLKLDATLKANGRNVEALTKQYNDLASELQNTTVIADEVVLGFLRQAETFGLTGDAAQKAVKDAISLAGAIDGTAQSASQYIRFAAAMAKGDIELAQHMSRMIPQLRGIKDQTEFIAKAQQLMAGGMATVLAEAQTTTGAMAMLKNAYGDFLEEIGKVVSQGLGAFIKDVRNAVAWMQSWDESTKSTIAVIASLLTVFLSIGPALKVLGLIASVVFTPITAVIGAALAITGVWIESIGGLAKAWESIRGAAIAAWEWLEPTRTALASLFDTILSVGAYIWEEFKTTAVAVWGAITSTASVNWSKVQDAVVTGIQFMEFSIKNFGQVSNFVWTGIVLAVSETTDAIADLFHGLAATLYGVWAAITSAFTNMFRNMWIVGSNYVQNQVDDFRIGLQKMLAAVNLIPKNVAEHNINEIIEERNKRNEAGAGDLRNVGEEAARAYTEGFESSLSGFDVGDSDMTKNLRKEYERLGKDLSQTFEEFQNDKWFESLLGEGEEGPVKKAGDLGTKMGQAINGKAEKESKKLEAALFGSVEALSRIDAFQDTLRGNDTSKASANPEGAVGTDSAAGLEKQDKQIDLLRGIRDGIKEKKSGGEVRIIPAGLV